MVLWEFNLVEKWYKNNRGQLMKLEYFLVGNRWPVNKNNSIFAWVRFKRRCFQISG